MNQNDMQIQDLRDQFFSKLESSDPDIFHPADISKIKTNDQYLRRFLIHNDQFSEALDMLWDTCEWRKKFGVNDINEKNVNREILDLGSIFPYGKDKDGKTMLVFKSKKHHKGDFDFEDQKKCLIYWMERLERQENGDKISLFFDMDGAVLGNMDMDYTKYLIGLFRNYYPNFLNYIIIFEMAWVLNAVFKVIKTFLPPKAMEKMKFVNKSNVKDYVDMECALKSWGGKDLYLYQFESEQKEIAAAEASSGEDCKKKVHFADTAFKSDHPNENEFEETSSPAKTNNPSNGRLTSVEVMIFNNDGNEFSSSLLLKNDESHSVFYKIKTTSPEKFRVKPSTGTLPPGASSCVSVVLLPGHQIQSIQKDKFLILSTPISNTTDMSHSKLNELWKQIGDNDVRQHKIQCLVPQANNNDLIVKNGATFGVGSGEQKIVEKLCSDISKLNGCAGCLRDELKLIRRQQWMILLALIVLICCLTHASYFEYSKSNGGKHNCWTDSANV